MQYPGFVSNYNKLLPIKYMVPLRRGKTAFCSEDSRRLSTAAFIGTKHALHRLLVGRDSRRRARSAVVLCPILTARLRQSGASAAARRGGHDPVRCVCQCAGHRTRTWGQTRAGHDQAESCVWAVYYKQIRKSEQRPPLHLRAADLVPQPRTPLCYTAIARCKLRQDSTTRARQQARNIEAREHKHAT